MFKNVHSRTIHNSPKLETVAIILGQTIRNEDTTATCNNMDTIFERKVEQQKLAKEDMCCKVLNVNKQQRGIHGVRSQDRS